MLRLLMIIQDSRVWVPCKLIQDEEDEEAWSKIIREAADRGEQDSLEARIQTNRVAILLVSYTLRNGDDLFLPIFTFEGRMENNHEEFSVAPCHFLKANDMMRNNEKAVNGFVINAFSKPFVVPLELFEVIGCLRFSVELNPS